MADNLACELSQGAMDTKNSGDLVRDGAVIGTHLPRANCKTGGDDDEQENAWRHRLDWSRRGRQSAGSRAAAEAERSRRRLLLFSVFRLKSKETSRGGRRWC